MYAIMTNVGFVMNPLVRGSILKFNTAQEAQEFIHTENKWLVTEIVILQN